MQSLQSTTNQQVFRISGILVALVIILVAGVISGTRPAEAGALPLRFVSDRDHTYILPSTTAPGSLIQAIYFVCNDNPSTDLRVALGMSISPTGSSPWINDINSDVSILVRAYTCQSLVRSFRIPAVAAPGVYTVWYAIRENTISGPFIDDIKRRDLTVVAPPDTTPPPRPQLLNPTAGEDFTTNPTLTWQGVSDPEGNGVFYEIQVSTNSTFTAVVRLAYDMRGASWAVDSPTLTEGRYHWRVRAYDGVGNYSDWVVSRYFDLAEPHRKIIFVQGINSDSGTCGKTFRDRVAWVVEELTDNPWLPEDVPSFSESDDFFYFSYSGSYCDSSAECCFSAASDPRADLANPQYESVDTCNGIITAAGRLNKMVLRLHETYPGSKFDVLAHSMGGLVTAFWLSQLPETPSFINSVVTFDSPLRGIKVIPPWPWNGACDRELGSWTDLHCIEYSQAGDQSECASTIVPAIARVGAAVPFYTLDATQRIVGDVEMVPGDRTTLLSSASKVHCQVDDDHSSAWDTARTQGDAVGCWIDMITATEPAQYWITSPETNSAGTFKGTFVACAIALMKADCPLLSTAGPSNYIQRADGDQTA